MIKNRVVDNRVFLLGLDKFYREAMKSHERGELLACARVVAGALRTGPAQVPVEGYYTEDAQLTEYFQLMCALKELNKDAATAVWSLPEFRRLNDVTSSRLYGLPNDDERTLFSPPRDALSEAMKRTQWTVPTLTAAAYDAALATDDYSLVGIAARAKDPVVLTALRESAALYAPSMLMGKPGRNMPGFVWKVDREIECAARRFVDTFKALFAEDLPAPEEASAGLYWYTIPDIRVVGRCARIGFDDARPVSHYHWAICSRHGKLAVEDFWRPDIWTTDRYRQDAGR